MLAAELYQRVRRRLDIEPSSYLDDLEIGQVCAEQYIELWDLILSTMGDEAPWERATVVVDSGTDQVGTNQADGIHRIIRLDILGPGNVWEPILRFELGDAPLDATPREWVSARSVRYSARRSFRASNASLAGLGVAAFAQWELYFDPPPTRSVEVRIHYIPPPRIIMAVNPSAPPAVTYSEFPDEFPEYVVEGAAAVFAAKQEIDPAPFLASKQRISAMIERYYRPHQLTQGRRVLDHRRQQLDELDDWHAFQNRGRYA